MTRSFLRFSLAFALGAVTSTLPAAQAGAKPKIIVVPGKGKPAVPPPVIKNLIEKALAEQADVMALGAYKKAINAKVQKKLSLKPKDLLTPEGLAAAAPEVGLTHALIVEGVKEMPGGGKKGKPTISIKVTLLKLPSGEQAFSNAFAYTKGNKLTPDVATPMMEAVLAALTATPETSPAPVAAEQPPPPAAPAAETAAAEPTPVAAEPPPAPAPASAPVASADPAPAAEPAPAPQPVAEPATTVTAAAPRERATAAKARPGLAVTAGAFAFFRKAQVSDGTVPMPLTYTTKASEPLPGVIARLELYPLAFGGNGSWYEGFGLDAEAVFTRVSTQIDGTPPKLVPSNIVGGKGGLSVRVGIGDDSDVRVRLGYSMFQFPLEGSGFPGLSFQAPYAGLGATFGLAKQVAVVLAADYLLKMSVGDGGKLLGTLGSGAAYHAEGGLRLTFAPIRIDVLARLEQYGATFKGTTTMTNVVQQYTNAKISDRYISGFALAGIEM